MTPYINCHDAVAFLEGYVGADESQAAREAVAYLKTHLTSETERGSAPKELEAIIEWVECREFYELMQTYRHMPASRQSDVLDAYRAVKEFIAKEIMEDRRERIER